LRWLAAHRAVKVALPQDEYDHAHTLDDWLAELGVAIVGTNFDAVHRPTLYPRLHGTCRFVKCLTGYIDDAMAASIAPTLRPSAERPLDIVYRASRLPYWFGHHGQLKHRIADRVRDAADRQGLKTDISTDPRATISSDRWYDFLASGRATIGCESGSSVLDARGEIQTTVKQMLAENPGLSFEDVSGQLPAGWDDYRFFAIGPRHLEAVMTRTCQMLVEGEYDGILRAGEHYLAIRLDLANLDEVLAMARDHALLDRIADQAYNEVFRQRKLTYAAPATAIDRELAATTEARTATGSDALLRLRIRLSTAGRLLYRACRGALRRVGRKLRRSAA
jgi:hypothetical protein